VSGLLGSGFLFDAPAWLLLLAVVPLAWWMGQRHGRAAVRLGAARLLDASGTSRSWRVRFAFVPRVLEVAAVLLWIVALARPVERIELERQTEGIDVMLCVDVSSSMTATDLDPQRTRLEVARAAATSFTAGRSDDRVGLVRFARYPDLVCPPTLDHGALVDLLGSVELVDGEGPEDQTGIGTAVARCAKALRLAPAGKVIVLLTDGEENVAIRGRAEEIGPAAAARLCGDLGIRVYAIAAGLGKRERNGAFTPIDTSPIEALAEATGGRFFAARDAQAVAAVYEEIDRLERAAIAAPRYEDRDRFLPFALLGLVLLLLGRALGGTVLEVTP
jgi:Ca-activated chloride channel family protein